MTAQTFDLLIFDWDGTLFNSIDQIVRSLQFAARQHGQTLSAEDGKNVIGLALPEVMQTLFPQVPHLQDAILHSYAQHYVAHCRQDSLFDGIEDLLRHLRAKGKQLAIATGKSRAGLNRVLEQIPCADVFSVTRTADEALSKPNPLMLQQILQMTDVPIHKAVMIGDSSYDLAMAQNMGMACIGVSYGVHGRDILQQYQPLSIADSVADLSAYLDKI